MSGGSKNSGDGSDDLLSQLLDLEESNVVHKKDDSSSEENGFQSATKIDAVDDDAGGDRTEVLVKETKKEVPEESFEDLDFGDFAEESSDNRTEVISKNSGAQSQQSLDDFLGIDTNADEVLEEATVMDAVENNPFSDDAKRNQTIVLDEPLSEVKDDPSDLLSDDYSEDKTEMGEAADFLGQALEENNSERDPIEEALAEYAEDEASSDEAEAPTAQSGLSAEADEVQGSRDAQVSKETVDDLFSDDDANDLQAKPSSENAELSAEDFADVFKSGPIQVPSETSSRKSSLSKLKPKVIGIAASVVVFLGLAGFFAWKFTTEQGVLGYRLEAWAIENVYQKPDEQSLAQFKVIMDEARKALFLDDPQKIKNNLSAVQGILILDERNIESVALHMEMLAVLMSWEGLQGSLPAEFDQLSLKANEILARLKVEKKPDEILRANAWRSLAAGEYSQSFQSLASAVQPDSLQNSALLGELAYRSGLVEKARDLLKPITNNTLRRAVYYKALAFNDRPKLVALNSESYLPAEVELEIQSAAENSSTKVGLQQLDKLFEKVKAYRWLAIKVQSKRGDLFAKSGNEEKARAEWNEIVKSSPNEEDIWFLLAKSYERDSLWDEALNAYKTAVSVGGRTNRKIALGYIQLLRIRMKVVDALEEIDKSLKEFPNVPEFLYEKGLAEKTLNQLDSAKASFDLALKADPKFEPAILGLAEIAQIQQDYAEASKLLSQIDSKSSNYGRALEGLGKLAMAKREYTDAKKYFALAVRENPESVDAYEGLVFLLLRSEDDQKALALVDQAIQKMPKSAEAHRLKAEVLEFSGKNEEALAVLEPFLKTHNHLTKLLMTQADILIESRDFNSAKQVLTELSQRDLADPEVDYLMAKAYSRGAETSKDVVLGSNEAAWRLLQDVTRRAPENEKYLVLKAQVALLVDERIEAHKIVEKIRELYPRNPDALVLKADLASYDGQVDEAVSEYNSALKLTRFKGPIYLKLAKLYSSQGDTQKAIANWHQVARWSPSNSSAYLELGKLYNEQGDFAKAQQMLKSAIRRNPKKADAYYYLAFIQKELGNSSSAVKNFERYLQLDPNGVEAATVRDEVYFLKNSGISN